MSGDKVCEARTTAGLGAPTRTHSARCTRPGTACGAGVGSVQERGCHKVVRVTVVERSEALLRHGQQVIALQERRKPMCQQLAVELVELVERGLHADRARVGWLRRVTLLVDEAHDAHLPQGRHTPMQPADREGSMNERNQLRLKYLVDFVAHAVVAWAGVRGRVVELGFHLIHRQVVRERLGLRCRWAKARHRHTELLPHG